MAAIRGSKELYRAAHEEDGVLSNKVVFNREGIRVKVISVLRPGRLVFPCTRHTQVTLEKPHWPYEPEALGPDVHEWVLRIQIGVLGK